MFLSLLIENFAYALISRYPFDFFANIVVTVFDPIYQWVQRLEVIAQQQSRIIFPFL